MKENEQEQEYFVVANSCAAPFFSYTSTSYIKGISAEDAMSRFIKSYKHPCGLYATNLYKSADDYHKGKEPLSQFKHPSIDKKKE